MLTKNRTVARETDLEIEKYTDIFAQGDARQVRTIKSKSCFVYINRFSTYVMNEQTHKNGQQKKLIIV